MKLSEIQNKLKVPKSQENKFGGYLYRSCEDILEMVKPFLGDSVLTLTDEMVQLGDRFYVKATATITYGTQTTIVSAYAREPLARKGMDESQITGSASSYARKYALGGLFLIDDTQDADFYDNTEKPEPTKQAASAKAKATTPAQSTPPTAQTPQAAQPAKRPVPTAAEKELLVSLFDYYTAQNSPSYRADKARMCNAIWTKLQRWPQNVQDAAFIKQYVTLLDCAANG